MAAATFLKERCETIFIANYTSFSITRLILSNSSDNTQCLKIAKLLYSKFSFSTYSDDFDDFCRFFYGEVPWNSDFF